MIAIILCAGFGTRMYPLTKNKSKLLLKVGGKPIVEYLTDQIIEFDGLKEIHIITNDIFFGVYTKWLSTYGERIQAQGISISLYNDETRSNAQRLGAAGDLALVVNHIKHKCDAMVAAGDNIFRFSLKPIWKKFMESEFNYVLAIPEEDKNKLKQTGILEIDSKDYRVLNFYEKPKLPITNLTCPALYFLKHGSLMKVNKFIESDKAKDEIGLFIKYLVEEDSVFAFKVDGERLDIGTIQSYEYAKSILKNQPVIL